MLAMFSRHVCNSCRGHRAPNLDMPRMFAILQQYPGQLNLHLQCGLLGA